MWQRGRPTQHRTRTEERDLMKEFSIIFVAIDLDQGWCGGRRARILQQQPMEMLGA